MNEAAPAEIVGWLVGSRASRPTREAGSAPAPAGGAADARGVCAGRARVICGVAIDNFDG